MHMEENKPVPCLCKKCKGALVSRWTKTRHGKICSPLTSTSELGYSVNQKPELNLFDENSSDDETVPLKLARTDVCI